ncbi:MAG: hypothetical protein CL927_19145 [Deltaproteobacteria bacterium]|mgnify:CR=1 FL=1|nr:hypothetical protein [Deltaproteobacteria bacterium]
MNTTEAVQAFREWVASTSGAHPAPEMVQAVLSAVEAFPVESPAPGHASDGPCLAAAALLDTGPTIVGLAASPRTALALYDAHESWSGDVSDLEAEQARDLVARVACLAAVAAGLDDDPERGLAQLLDHPAGRALVNVFVAIEIVLARGTAFEPVEPGVITDAVSTMDEVVSEALEALGAAGGRSAEARILLPNLLEALEDVADSLADQIEEIAEAVRTHLPEQAGDRAGWQAEARDLRIYGLLVARITSGVSAEQTAPSVESTSPAMDVEPIRARLQETLARRDTLATAVEHARSRHASLQQDQTALQTRRPTAAPVAASTPSADPMLQDAVDDALGALQRAQQQLAQQETRLTEHQPPAERASTKGGRTDAAQATVAQAESRVAALQVRIEEAQQQQQSAVEQQAHLNEQLQRMQERQAATRTALEHHRSERAALQAQITATHNARDRNKPASKERKHGTRSISVRERAILRGTVLRARAQAVSARTELATKERSLKAGPPPSAAPNRPAIDIEGIRSRITACESEIQRLQKAIAAQRKARTNRIQVLQTRLEQAQAQRSTLASSRQGARGRRKRHAKNLASTRKAHAKAADRPEPVSQEVVETLTPEARESLDDAVFEAINRLHRARWTLNRANDTYRTEQPKQPEAPEHAHIHRALEQARKTVALADDAVTEIRSRLDAAITTQRSAIARIEAQRLPRTNRLETLRTLRAELASSRQTTTDAQQDRTTRLSALVVPAPWPENPPSVLVAQRADLGTLREAVAAARDTLNTITEQGARLPPPPEPRADRVSIDLSSLRKAVLQAERSLQQTEARKARLMAQLAELRAPLAAEHRVLTDRKKRLAKTLHRFQKRRAAGQRRLGGLQDRRATTHEALQKPQPPLPDLISEPSATRDAATVALETARATLQERSIAERVLRDTPPAGAADPMPAQEATAQARVVVEICTAAVADVESRIARSIDLTARHKEATSQREALVPQVADARERRADVVSAQSDLAPKIAPLRASIAALKPAAISEDPALIVLRQVTQATGEAVEAARSATAALSGPPDPPTVPPDQRAQLKRIRKAKAKAVQKLEAAARKIETRRDRGYVTLRQEHRVALEQARPKRKLQALRRRRQALERARKARLDRKTSLVAVLSEVISVPAELQSRVTCTAADVQNAREVLGQSITQVANLRSEMSRRTEAHRAHEDALEVIDEALARWTRRSRRTERAIQKLRDTIAAAEAARDEQSAKPNGGKPEPDATDIHHGASPPPVLTSPPSGTPRTPPAPLPLLEAPPGAALPAATDADEPYDEDSTLLPVMPPEEEEPPATVPVLPLEPKSTPPPPPPGLGGHATRSTSAPPDPSPAPTPSDDVLVAPALPSPEQAQDAGSVEPPRVPPMLSSDDPDGAPPPVPSSVQSLLARIAARRSANRRTPSPSATPPVPPPVIPGIQTTLATPAKVPEQPSPFETPALPTVTVPEPVVPTPGAPAQSRFNETEADISPAPSVPDTDASDFSLPPPIHEPPPDLSARSKATAASPNRSVNDRPEAIQPAPAPPLGLPPDPGLPPLPPASPMVTDPSVIDDPSMPVDPSIAERAGKAVKRSNQPLHNAKTMILSREELLRRAMLEDDEDSDDDANWNDDGAKTMLLSRDEQLRRRDALLAERDDAPKRRREHWKPPSKSKK